MTMTSSVDVAVVGGGLVGACGRLRAGRGGRLGGAHRRLAARAGVGRRSRDRLSRDVPGTGPRSGSSSVLGAARHLRSLVARLVAEDGADPGPDAFAECGSLVVALAEHEDPWFTEVMRRDRRPQPRRHRDRRRRGAAPCSRRWARLWRALLQPVGGPGRRSDAVRAPCGRAAQRRGVTFVSPWRRPASTGAATGSRRCGALRRRVLRRASCSPGARGRRAPRVGSASSCR